MRRFTLFTIAAAVAVALIPAGAGAQEPATAVPPPQPILIKLGHTPLVELSDGGGGLPFLNATAPYDAGDWQPALRKFHDSGTYDAEIEQIDDLAMSWVRRESRGSSRAQSRKAAKARKAKARARAHARKAGVRRHARKARHARHAKRSHARPALVLDIDETSLSNYTAIDADNFTFGPASQAEATDEIGKAIVPTRELFDLAKSRGVAVFFITGRPEAQRAVTIDNLQREGFTGFQSVTLKPAGTTLTTVAYKSGARAAIEKQGFHIIANVGDQYSDLAGGHADRAFKLPNPFYFLP
jgi:predicted secreted acid phosphatase